ncbi:MAG: sulfur carrier protein ThiS [Muribaculaceae bacterium]|nr:sulfur carrier protein ThiS [Muribaculaceae bacterium]
MKVVLNTREIEVASSVATLEDLLKSESLTGRGMAVAVNNRVVPKNLYSETPLEEGMKITVIKAVCGG